MINAKGVSLTTLWIVLLVAGCRGETPSADRKEQAAPATAQRKRSSFSTPVDGTAKEVRYLIVHADDAGLCPSVNRATIEAMEKGIVTSASIMVPCPAFEEFAEYARNHPEHDYGIHLTLNAEFRSHRWGPISPRGEVPGLVDSEGYLWAEPAQTAANARAEEVERELSAQIDRALALKVPISHLDSHMGALFTRPDFLEVYVNLGIKYDLPILFVRNGDGLEQFPVFRRSDRTIRELSDKLKTKQMPILDRLEMHYAPDSLTQRFSRYRQIVRALPVGVSELIVHCGYADRELYAVTGSAPMRDADRRIMTDTWFAKEIESKGIQLIDWKQFRKMQQRPAVETKTE